MDAGAFDQKIGIQTLNPTIDALGAEVANWNTVSAPFAKVIETAGREFLKGALEAEGLAVFVIRWRTVDPTSRVVWRGRVFTIDAITGTQREGYAWLHCKTLQEAA